MRRVIWILPVVLAVGCGGQFILTAPDVAVPAGENAPVVVRLQRREVWAYAPPQKGSAITFRLGDKVQRCARTDEAGYAAVSIETPARPGRYGVAMYHQDVRGDSVTGEVAIYVLQADEPIAVVDMDSLPQDADRAGQAVEALVRIQKSAQVIYVTQKHANVPPRARELLERAGYPDGPVLPYSRPSPWYRKWPRRRENEGMLDVLRQQFPQLRWGVTAETASAKAFAEAGLKVLVVGEAKVRSEDVERFDSWADLQIKRSAVSSQPSADTGKLKN